MVEIRDYLNRRGKDVFDEWLSSLKDARTQAKIASRCARECAHRSPKNLVLATRSISPSFFGVRWLDTALLPRGLTRVVLPGHPVRRFAQLSGYAERTATHEA